MGFPKKNDVFRRPTHILNIILLVDLARVLVTSYSTWRIMSQEASKYSREGGAK